MSWARLIIALGLAGCAHSPFAGTWYKHRPLVLRLEPSGVAIFHSTPEQLSSRPMARGTWAESEGQLLVVVPPGGCLGTPNERAEFFSLRFVEGVPQSLRVELVSAGYCPELDAMVAEEYRAAAGSQATAKRPSGDWHKVDTHIAQGTVAELKDNGRFAVLVPRYTQSGTSEGIGYTAVTAGTWSSRADLLEFVDDQHGPCSNPAKTHYRVGAGAGHQATFTPLADSCQAMRDLNATPWTHLPAIADLFDACDGPAADNLVGRWLAPLDPLVRIHPDGSIKVTIDAASLATIMQGSWQADEREGGIAVRIPRGGCAAEPSVLTEYALLPKGAGSLNWAHRLRGCDRFEPLRGQEFRGLVRLSGTGAGSGSWSGDWHPQPPLYWIVAFFPNGQYAIALPRGSETHLLAFGTWLRDGNQVRFQEQAGTCQHSPGESVGSYTIDSGTATGTYRTMRLHKRQDACAMRSPFDGATWLSHLPPPAPDHDTTFDGQ